MLASSKGLSVHYLPERVVFSSVIWAFNWLDTTILGNSSSIEVITFFKSCIGSHLHNSYFPHPTTFRVSPMYSKAGRRRMPSSFSFRWDLSSCTRICLLGTLNFLANNTSSAFWAKLSKWSYEIHINQCLMSITSCPLQHTFILSRLCSTMLTEPSAFIRSSIVR